MIPAFLLELRRGRSLVLWVALVSMFYAGFITAFYPTILENAEDFERALAGVPFGPVGEVVSTARLEIVGLPRPQASDEPGEAAAMSAPLVITADLETLKEAWQRE